ncbi:MAG: aldehyde ferredoxin oxidoreductase family protein [Candidatus Thorarchaeota archaeon]|jgi:aldehyde:ferredoxin oxidoreductase
MHGYMGQILVVDLTDKTTSNLPIDERIASKFIGGSGYASKLLYDIMDHSVDPLGPDNMLLFMTGPLTGTLAPSTGRLVVCGKSPLTGIWGEAHVGGHFGAKLKFSGFDGILIKGRSDEPTMIHINEGRAELESASELWGMKTGEAQEFLRKKLGRVRVACIGPAGENLVKFAGIMTDERSAARCGLGAVMGSKNLKAITVAGSQKIEVADPEGFTNLARESSKLLGEVMHLLRDSGTSMYVEVGMMFNDMPIKYFQETEFEYDSLTSTAMKEFLTGRLACYSCPIACGRVITLPEHGLEKVAGPEFQTIAAFGSNLMISDLKKVSVINNLCNQYGMDTISCGSTIAFATHLCDLGKLNLGLEWGDVDKAIELVHAIATRSGVGDELAEGSVQFAKKHDASDLVIHVRGLEVPNHDPRAFAGMATVYAIASRGATHMEGDMYSVDLGGMEERSIGIYSGDRLDNEGKGETAARAQDFRAFFDSIMMCHFAQVPFDRILELVSKATGMPLTSEDVLLIGSRTVTTKRLFNLKCGLKSQDDCLPPPLLKPLPDYVTDDFVPDMHMQLNDYYEYRGWDRTTGAPTSETLERLGL